MPFVRHLAIRCRNLEKSREFYETGIGWNFLGYRPGRGGLDLTDGEINVTLIQQPPTWSPERHDDGCEHLHFGVIVSDLTGCWQRLLHLGAEFATDSVKAGETAVGNRPPEVSFKVFDPDGNVFDVTCNQGEWVGVKMPSPDRGEQITQA